MAPRPEGDPDEAETRIAPAPRPVVIAGRYHLVRRLAAGAFGVVHEGYYTILDQRRRVAVKLLKPAANADPATVLRFREEVRTISLLNHPNICKVVDGGIDGGTWFLVMEFAEGGSLKEQIEKSPDRRVAPAAAARWLREAAQGLLAAEQNRHEDGEPAPVYHRDVKPANLLLQDGRVVVADFGAAKLGGNNPGITSEIVPALWTPEYGSPEQQIGIVDHRSDLYSLGATFFHLLTGQRPQDRFDDIEQRFSTAHDPSTVCPSVPAELGAIVRRMTEPLPERRYQSFEELLADLAGLDKPPGPPKLLVRGLVAVVALLLLAAGMQVAGLVDWFGPRVVLDAEALPLGEVQARSVAVRDELARVRRDTDWMHLSSLEARTAELLATAEANVRIAGEIAAWIGPEQQPRLPEAFHPLDALEEKKGLLVARIGQQVGVRDRLRELEGRVTKGMATSVAREQVRSLRREMAAFVAAEELAAFATNVETRIAEVDGDRRRRLAGLEGRLQQGDLPGLKDGAEQFATAMDQCEERELANAARECARLVGVAQEVLRRCPTWPPDGVAGAEVLAALEGLATALRTCAELGGGLDPRLRPWWDGHTAELCGRWAAAAAQAIEPSVKEHGQAVAVFNENARAGRWDAGRRQVLETQQTGLQGQQSFLRDLLSLFPGRSGTRLLQALAFSLPSLAMAPYDAPIDLSGYAELVTDPQYSIDPAAGPTELQDAAERVVAARQAIRKMLEDVGARAATAKDLEALADLKNRLRNAKDQHAEAGRLLAAYVAAEAGLETLSCARLRADCRPTSVTEALPQLDARRRSLSERVEALATERTGKVERLRERLRGGEEEPATTAAAAVEVATVLEGQGETVLAERARQCAADARAAGVRLSGVPTWSPSPEPCLADLAGFAQALQDLGTLEVDRQNTDLVAWWNVRRQRIADQWCEQAAACLAGPRGALERRIRAYEAMAQGSEEAGREHGALSLAIAEHQRAVQGVQALTKEGLARRLLQIDSWRQPLPPVRPPSAANVVRREPPEGWPNAAYQAPVGIRSRVVSAGDAVCQRLYPAEFLSAAAAAGMRLWYFDGRRSRSGEGEPVYMAYFEDAAAGAVLVDVHPVTMGQMRAVRAFWASEQYRKAGFEGRSDETMAYDTSRAIAESFGKTLANVVDPASPPAFELWTTALRRSASARPFGAAPVAARRLGYFPTVQFPLQDLSRDGIAYLHSGVLEWTKDGADGVSEMGPESENTPRRRDTGFRLALVLPRW